MSRSIFIHQKAIVEPGAHIGKGTRVWAFAHILSGAIIGEDCNICDHTFIENDVVIGNRVTIKCGIYIWDGVHIEDDVHLGPNAVFTNDMYPRSKKSFDLKRTLVGRGATIGANATILPGITIGKSAMIGAGSVVTKDVPSYALVIGNPARRVGSVCVCGSKLLTLQTIMPTVCGDCGREYEWNGTDLKLKQG